MYRSYFFALLSCALFSAGALINAYSNLPEFNGLPPVSLSGVESTVPGNFAFPEQNEGARKDGTAEQGEAVEQRAAVEQEGAAEQREAVKQDDPAQLSGFHSSASEADPNLIKAMPAVGVTQSVGLAQSTKLTQTAEPAPSSKLTSSSRRTPSIKQTQSAKSTPSTPLNAQTDNFNILLLGTDGDKLEMVCVYSINHHLIAELKSVSLFFPVNSVVIYKGSKTSLDNIYRQGGWQAVAEAVGNTMYININQYVKIDRQALRDLDKYFEPIYVDGERVEIETLFVRRTSHNDDRIIARILRQVLRPQVFFQYIPKLVFGVNGGIESNFSFTPRNLVDYYRIAKRLSTKRIKKVVLLGTPDWHNGCKVNIPPEEPLRSGIFQATQ